ncbi:MAG: exodeoxyribonuclease VII small subunit [Bacteroidales bacterium]|nr:exodeoxyribonuclease VII small subunit [Bacteroidales bacterium]
MKKSDTQSTEKASFDSSFAELERINKELENADISVDLMSDYAKECLPLVRTCKEKLSLTQKDVDLLMKELENE